MVEERPFYVFRFSLIEESQQALVPRALPSPKGAAALDAISSDREFSHNGVEYAFIGFREIRPTPHFDFPENRYFIGKMARHGKAHVGERVPGDIVEYVEDDWIPVLTIFDLVGQYVFIQKDWKFGTEAQTAGAVQAGVRGPILDLYNHLVFVEPMTRTERFWEIVDAHSKIYKVQLNLISPNILETNRKARDALEALERIFNQDEMKVILESESGQLQIPRNPTADYLAYIAEGEGSWKVTTDGGPRGGKKTFTSKECVETVDLSMPEEQAGSGTLFDVAETSSESKNLHDARRASELFTWAAKRLRRN